MTNEPEKPIAIGDVYPHLSREQQQEVLQNLQDYLAVVKRIHNRLKGDGKLEEVLLRAQWQKRNRKKKS